VPVAPVNPSSGIVLGSRDSIPWLRRELIAPWWEIFMVLAFMLGPFVYSSTRYALSVHSNHYISQILTNHKLLGLMATESFELAVMFGYLRWRGWKPSDFKIGINWKGTVVASPIAICAYTAMVVTSQVALLIVIACTPHPAGWQAALKAYTPPIQPHSLDVSWFFIIAGSTLNAFLEELVFMGFAFNQLAAKGGPVFALMTMVLLRLLIHTYQGPANLAGVAALSLVFGLVYRYLRKLWPIILAHAIIDIAVFTLAKIIFGR
jgi:membrane protease YdiL (CAAX protease family)